jgi:hypothetical protein
LYIGHAHPEQIPGDNFVDKKSKQPKAEVAGAVPALVAAHIKKNAQGIKLFKASGSALTQALAQGAKVGEAITLPDGSVVTIVDQFATKSEVFMPKVFHRYKVEDYKPAETK